jgi:hypothetical protein
MAWQLTCSLRFALKAPDTLPGDSTNDVTLVTLVDRCGPSCNDEMRRLVTELCLGKIIWCIVSNGWVVYAAANTKDLLVIEFQEFSRIARNFLDFIRILGVLMNYQEFLELTELLEDIFWSMNFHENRLFFINFHAHKSLVRTSTLCFFNLLFFLKKILLDFSIYYSVKRMKKEKSKRFA